MTLSAVMVNQAISSSPSTFMVGEVSLVVTVRLSCLKFDLANEPRFFAATASVENANRAIDLQKSGWLDKRQSPLQLALHELWLTLIKYDVILCFRSKEDFQMKGSRSSFKSTLVLLMVALLSWMPFSAYSQNVTERPSGLEMTADVVVVRPLTLAATVLGAGLFVVSLPFSALGGNAGEAAETLVGVPFKATFMRCLGCSEKHLRAAAQKAKNTPKKVKE